MAGASFDYVLGLADDALILGHRLSQWCGHAPMLEEELALANIGLDLIGQALCLRARVVAIPAGCLSLDFFALSSGVAGAIAGKFATYRIRLAIVGDISAHLHGSSALRAFVHEANRGPSIWFVPSSQALADRLELEFGRLASVTERAADESS